MTDLKRIAILSLFFLFVGVSFSNGLLFKKKTVVEEVIEYEDIVTKVSKVKRRIPASTSDEDIIFNERKEVRRENFSSRNTVSSNKSDHYQNDLQEEGSSTYSSSSRSSSFPENSLITLSLGSELASSGGYESGESRASSLSSSSSSTGVTNNLTAGGGFFVGNVTPPSPSNSNTSRPSENNNRKVSFKVHSLAIKNGELILTGENLSAVKKISVQGESLSKELVKVSSTSSKLVAMGVSGIKMTMGQIYNLVVSDAYASTTFPIEFEIRDGSITPRKLAPLSSAEDGFVLKWDSVGRTWVAAPDEVGAGPDGGITSITKGTGIQGANSSITTTGVIAVDVGTDINQIPQFDDEKKLTFESENALAFKNNDEDQFIFGISNAGEFEFKKQKNLGAEVVLFKIEGDEIIINGQKVCLEGGDNCPTTGGDYVSAITVNPPLIASGTENVNLSIGIDGSTITLNGSNQLTLSQMGATPGQVLKWGPSGWAAEDDLDTTIAEADPKVRAFAHKDNVLAEPQSCALYQTLQYNPATEAFSCVDIVLNNDQIDAVITAAVEDLIVDGVTDVAPSQNAVHDALVLKQDKITTATDLRVKSLSVMLNDLIGVAIQPSPSTTGIIPFVLPPNTGTAGYVLKTDGNGNLSWGSPTEGSVTNITTSAPLSATPSGGSVALSLDAGGITNSHISSNPAEAISWSKINKTGSTTINAGIALSGGGDLSANRTFDVNVDGLTIGVNGSNQLSLATGSITNDHIKANAGIEWSKIDKTGSAQIIAGTGLDGGGDLTGDITLNIDVGTNANQIVQLDANGKLPAIDGSNLTNVGHWIEAITSGIAYPGGNVGIGTDNPTHLLTLSGSSAAIAIDRFNAGPHLVLRQARGTQASPTATQVGDVTGKISGNSYDGSSYQTHASIDFHASENQAATNRGSYMTFSTTNTGAASSLERMRISPAGFVGVGSENPNERLTIEGVLSLKQVGAPVATSEYGKIYTKADNKLYFMNGLGVETALGSSDGGTPGDNTITSDKIADGSIVNADIANNAAIDASKIGTGVISNTELSYLDGVTSNIQTQITTLVNRFPAGTSAQYIRGDKTVATLNTEAVPESGANLYFTQDRVRATPLTGYAVGTNNALNGSENILGAFGKLQGQINASNTTIASHSSTLSTLSSKGQWNKSGSLIYYDGGNVGIGTNNPSQPLTVIAPGSTIPNNETWVTTTGNPTMSFYSDSSSSGSMDFLMAGASDTATVRPVLIGRKSRGTLASPTAMVSGDTLFSFLGSGHDGTTFHNPTSIDFVINGTVSNGVLPTDIAFLTGSAGRSEKMRITSNGNVGIGTTSPTSILHLANNAPYITYEELDTTEKFFTGVDASGWWIRQGSTASFDILSVRKSGVVGIGTNSPSEKLEVAGNVKASAYLYTSDERLKENVETLKDSYEKVLALRGVEFDWKENGDHEIGFIAQEVEVVEPHLVVTSSVDGIKAVKYANIVALLVEAFKDHHKKIEENQKLFIMMNKGIETRVKDLEREVASLREENQKLREDLELIKKHLKLE